MSVADQYMVADFMDGSSLLQVGKHKGKSFADVHSEDGRYCDWAVNISKPSGSLKDFQDFLKTQTLKRGPPPYSDQFPLVKKLKTASRFSEWLEDGLSQSYDDQPYSVPPQKNDEIDALLGDLEAAVWTQTPKDIQTNVKTNIQTNVKTNMQPNAQADITCQSGWINSGVKNDANSVIQISEVLGLEVCSISHFRVCPSIS